MGFVAVERAVADAAVRVLGRDPSWTLVDLRGRSAPDARADLVRAIAAFAKARLPLVLVVDAAVPAPALLFAKAVADRRHGGSAEADLGAGTRVALDPALRIGVVVDGTTEHAALPDALQRVDFWEFLR